MIYAGFVSILVQKDPNDSYKNKYEKRIPWSYGYKFACVDDKFSKHFMSFLGEDAVYNLVLYGIEEKEFYQRTCDN